MNFGEELEKICARVDGAVAAVIIAEDGIIVERHQVDPALDLELVSVEFAGAAREMRRSSLAVEAGELDEMLVVCRGRQAALRLIGPGYYLLMFFSPGALIGRARYELRRAAHVLANEFV
jgi:predicted regulator of Ras-like GTPase activity (Roadblock/LC7/MglB family)